MVLPWVALHAAKDYANLPLLFEQYPNVRHTINVVPSLMDQLDDVALGMSDPLRQCFLIDAAAYSDEQRAELISWIRTAQYATMVHPIPRFAALWSKLDQPSDLSAQECTDLKVCFLLAWVGPMHHSNPVVQRLLLKGALYNHDNVIELLNVHVQIAAEVTGVLRRLNDAQTIELSTTPFHHPILPLLLDSDVAQSSDSTCEVPQPAVRRLHDAHEQVRMALESHAVRFGHVPPGVWPAEGAVSTEALTVLSEHGVQWTATDAEVLRRTLRDSWTETSAYYPWVLPTPQGAISVLFRDRELSDAIGFSYASWNAEAAARDFIARLEERRRLIVAHDGDDALRQAVVPVILDGENCWEYYPNNGREFLQSLLHQLSESHTITTVHCSEASHSDRASGHVLADIHPGSWIDASFDVWIGSPAKNAAWSALRDVGELIDHSHGEHIATARAEYLAAQASDTFWWYHDRHQAPHKHMFDMLFRERLRHIYRLIEQPVPDTLLRPLFEVQSMTNETTYPILFSGAAMHVADALTSHVTVTMQEAWHRLVVVFRRWPSEGESVTLLLTDRHGQERSCFVTSNGEVLWHSPLHDEGCSREEHSISMFVRAASRWKLTVIEDVGPTRKVELDVIASE